MWVNFLRIFEEEEVDNVVWVMDYSCGIKDHFEVVESLWPAGNVVKWLFFNLFKFVESDDCVEDFKTIY